MSLETVVETDVLVIGGGIAGCFAAIKAKEQGSDVTLVDKGYVGKTGSSPIAGHFAVFNPEWGHDLAGWVNQVSFIGEYVNNPEWTEISFRDSYARFQDMLSWGLKFQKYPNGEWAFWPPRSPKKLAQFPIQSIRMPRRDNIEALRAQTMKTGVRIMDRTMVTDLLKQDGKIVGAIGMPIGSYDFYIFKAKATVIAAGTASLKPDGIPVALSGDGEAMAYRVGAEITGKEWNDNHWTSAEFPARQSIHLKWNVSSSRQDEYYSESGKPMLNALGDVFYADVLKSGTLNVTPYVYEADAGRAPVFFDLKGCTDDARRPAHYVAQGDPTPRQPIDQEAEKLERFRVVAGGGFGMSVEVSEGIWPVNTKCATQLPGLYVAGNSCGARQSGAAYPNVGFAMMSCSVTGTRAGLGAAEYALQMKKPTLDKEELARLKKTLYAPVERKGGFSPSWTTQVLRNIMLPYWILYLKHAERLQSALTQVEFLRDRILPKLMAKDPHDLRLVVETKNMVHNAEMKLRASLFRTESRGTHVREDFPRRDDPNWLAWVKIKEEQGEMKLYKEPIPKKWWPDLSLPYEERYPKRFVGE